MRIGARRLASAALALLLWALPALAAPRYEGKAVPSVSLPPIQLGLQLPGGGAAVAPAIPALPRLDLGGAKHIVFDLRGSRGGKGDVAAAYLTAADLLHRGPAERPRITFVTAAAEQKILSQLVGRKVEPHDNIFDGLVRVAPLESLAELPAADLYLALAAPDGEFASRHKLERVDEKAAAPGSIPISERSVVLNQTVLGNTESAGGPATALVGGHRLEMRTAGIAPFESGIYADPIARGLRGLSRERVREFVLDEIPADASGKLGALRDTLSGKSVKGAKPVLVYGVSMPEVKPQFFGYLKGLAEEAEQSGQSFMIVSPSAIEPGEVAKHAHLRRRMRFLDPEQPLPAVAERGMIYVLRTGALPHPVFIGMMALSAAPPIVAGDGAMSAAIALGRPFVMTRVSWNEDNIEAFSKRLQAETKDPQVRRLIRRIFGKSFFSSDAALREAQALSAHAELFERASRAIPYLTETLLSAARAARRLVEPGVPARALIAELEDPLLRASLLAARTIQGDPTARELAREQLRAAEREERRAMASALSRAAAERVRPLRGLRSFELPFLDALVSRLVLWLSRWL